MHPHLLQSQSFARHFPKGLRASSSHCVQPSALQHMTSSAALAAKVLTLAEPCQRGQHAHQSLPKCH